MDGVPVKTQPVPPSYQDAVEVQPPIYQETVEVQAVPVTSYSQVAPEREGAAGDVEMGKIGGYQAGGYKGGGHGGGGASPPIISDSGYKLPGDPRGMWRDNLCACLNAVPNCLCTCFCIWQPIAQEWEYVISKDSYSYVAPLLTIGWFIGGFLSGQDFVIAALGQELARVLEIAWWVICTVLLMIIRSNLRKKYNIPPTVCGPYDDCCCAFWCTPCVACQMWRHMTGNSPQAKGCSCYQELNHGCC